MMEAQCHRNINTTSSSRGSSVSPGLTAAAVSAPIPVPVSDAPAQYAGSHRGSSVSPVQLTELVPPSGSMFKTYSPQSDSNHNVTNLYGFHHHQQQLHNNNNSNDGSDDYRMESDRVVVNKDPYNSGVYHSHHRLGEAAYMDYEGKVLLAKVERYPSDSPGLYSYSDHLKDSASHYHQQLHAAAAFAAGAGDMCKTYSFSTPTTPEARSEFSSPGELPAGYIHTDSTTSTPTTTTTPHVVTYSTLPSAMAASPNSPSLAGSSGDSAHGYSPAEEGRPLVIITTTSDNNGSHSTVLDAASAAAAGSQAGCNNLPSQREDFTSDVHDFHHQQQHHQHSGGSASSSTQQVNYYSDEQSLEGDSFRDIQQEILSADIERHIYENYSRSHPAVYELDDKDSFFDDGSENDSPVAKGGSSQKTSVSPPSSKKRRRRSQTPLQRSAANMRERKRMCHLNVAFDRLKDRLPNVRNRKKLSRIQTLRAAIFYISLLADCVQTKS